MAKKTQSIVEMARPVIPLAAAATQMAALMHRIEDGQDMTEAFKEEFAETRIVEKESIDETIAFRGFLDAAEAHAKETSMLWADRMRQITKMRETLDDQIKASIKEDPDRTYRGTIGGLAVRNNPPSLKTSWGSNSLTKSIIDMFDVDDEFYEVIPPPPTPPPTYKLKTALVKAAIKAGQEFPWAKTERGNRVEVTR